MFGFGKKKFKMEDVLEVAVPDDFKTFPELDGWDDKFAYAWQTFTDMLGTSVLKSLKSNDKGFTTERIKRSWKRLPQKYKDILLKKYSKTEIVFFAISAVKIQYTCFQASTRAAIDMSGIGGLMSLLGGKMMSGKDLSTMFKKEGEDEDDKDDKIEGSSKDLVNDFFKEKKLRVRDDKDKPLLN